MAEATQIKTPDKIRQLQIALYRKAKTSPNYRFWSLYGELLRRDILETALQTQIENGGSAGVDGQTLTSINASAQTRREWLDRLQTELKTKTYRPAPVRRVMIQKSGGGQRPLGIPTVKDRVVQTALGMILMPIFEADFHPQSFGFRPKRDAHQAIEAVNSAVRRGYIEIIDADVSKYFDTIPHRGLMKAVAKRVSDGSVLRLIKQWLRAPIVEEDKDGTKRVIPNRCGTPQGGVISPLLANVYLNPLDHGVNENTGGQARMIRYADDFVIACRVGQSASVKSRLQRWLNAKGLKLNEVKTRMVNIRREGINFLGFNLTWRGSWKGRGYLHTEPSQKSRRALRENLSQILNHWTLWRPIAEAVKDTNAVLRGWSGYFHFRNSTSVMARMRRYSQNRLRRWLWRKHDCTRGLWEYYTDQRLREHYGLYELPITAAWTANR
jgi:group II intron reverse transcriptase/maturase